jgi:hypothetical protein
MAPRSGSRVAGGTAWPGLRAHVEKKRLDRIVGDRTEGVTMAVEAKEAPVRPLPA